jgi:hypothetical protein
MTRTEAIIIGTARGEAARLHRQRQKELTTAQLRREVANHFPDAGNMVRQAWYLRVLAVCTPWGRA